MTSHVPKDVAAAIDTAQKIVAKFRIDYASMLADTKESNRLEKTLVSQLFFHAVTAPNIVGLSTLLAQMVPLAAVTLPTTPRGALPKKNAERMLKLCAAVVEAGLAEQMHADLTLREGSALSAQKLEQSLDEWMVRGRHRAGLESAPLSKIDTMIAMHDGAPVDHAQVIETRFGLLVPVMANIHLWRSLQEMNPAEARLLGWCSPADLDAISPEANLDSSTSEQVDHG